jgi:hypothetical protein
VYQRGEVVKVVNFGGKNLRYGIVLSPHPERYSNGYYMVLVGTQKLSCFIETMANGNLHMVVSLENKQW